MARSKLLLGKLLPLILIFLGLLVQNACSPTEAPELTKRCDKKSTLTIKTECQSCSVNIAVKCPDGYIKITNGTVGVRDCRYSLKIQSYVLDIPGCRHICRKDYLQPQCCPGHWGPDCMGQGQLLTQVHPSILRKHIPNLPYDLVLEADGTPASCMV
uniref:Uncharacterized protein n=1 Tax=Mus musculus TaxID=10090 RepID=Q3TP65_MOUSE|nr:unnamed protein product [Mus musculus]